MNSSHDDERLEALLRQPSPEIRDDGFSTRVLMALPPRRSRAPLPARPLACAIGALAGLILFWARVDTGQELTIPMETWRNALTILAETAWEPEISIAAGTTLLSLLYAFRSNVRRWKRLWM